MGGNTLAEVGEMGKRNHKKKRNEHRDSKNMSNRSSALSQLYLGAGNYLPLVHFLKWKIDFLSLTYKYSECRSSV